MVLDSKYKALMVELEREHCAICLYKLVSLDSQGKEYVGMDDVLILPCGHVLHDKCIDDWLLNHVECPICRQDLETAMASSHPYAKQMFTKMKFRRRMMRFKRSCKCKFSTDLDCPSSGTGEKWFGMDNQKLQWLSGRQKREKFNLTTLLSCRQ